MAVDIAVRNDDGQVAVRAGAFTYSTAPPGETFIGVLAKDYDADDEALQIDPFNEKTLVTGQQFRIEQEILTADVLEKRLTWQRGAYNTAKATHQAGAIVFRGMSSGNGPDVLLNLPASGYTIAQIEEVTFNPAMLAWPYKTWHWRTHSGSLTPDGNLWLEIRHNNEQDGLAVRVYGKPWEDQYFKIGESPGSGRVTRYRFTADRRALLASFIDLRPSVPVFSLWAGDPGTGLVQIYERQTCRPLSYGIKYWDEEFNTSDNRSEPQLRDMVYWGRNLRFFRDMEQDAFAALLGPRVAHLASEDDPHRYFDADLLHPNFYLARSWRDASQLVSLNGKSLAPWSTVDAAEGGYRLWVPPFSPDDPSVLAATIGPDVTEFEPTPPVNGGATYFQNNRAYKVDAEAMACKPVPAQYLFRRGSDPKPYPKGTPVYALS